MPQTKNVLLSCATYLICFEFSRKITPITIEDVIYKTLCKSDASVGYFTSKAYTNILLEGFMLLITAIFAHNMSSFIIKSRHTNQISNFIKMNGTIVLVFSLLSHHLLHKAEAGSDYFYTLHVFGIILLTAGHFLAACKFLKNNPVVSNP